MQAFFYSLALVFISEMGDKTQLLSLVLVSRFRRPWLILSGVLAATLLNHALAAWAGGWLSHQVSPSTLKWILAATFFAFGLWVLIPDKEGTTRNVGKLGAFATTFVSFFLAEMGDKTQIATITLAATYSSPMIVTVGTTLGMLLSNALAIFFGHQFLCRIPMKYVRFFASVSFILFAVGIILNASS